MAEHGVQLVIVVVDLRSSVLAHFDWCFAQDFLASFNPTALNQVDADCPAFAAAFPISSFSPSLSLTCNRYSRVTFLGGFDFFALIPSLYVQIIQCQGLTADTLSVQCTYRYGT